MDFVQSDYLPLGYLINREGFVKSPKGKILKTSTSNSGYLFINVKNKGFFLHRALAFAFIDRCLDKNFINHIDGNKLNNDLCNLEWCTKSENTIHSYKLGLKKESVGNLFKGKSGNLHNRSKLVICIEDKKLYGSMSEAERYYSLGQGSVSWAVKHKKPIFGLHFEIAS